MITASTSSAQRSTRCPRRNPQPTALPIGGRRGTAAPTALVAALAGFLAAGTGPSHGGEKPYIVIYLHWDHVKGEIAKATRESGFPVSTGQARRYLFDAQILPVVLGWR
ncbi:hypothetical protein [Nakamurella sp. PAMC28650]|uniref:hypothetical protein n=1 Tax=Nakamurella sp. PAMC28650 TaxID=2762325 RepID=UPI00164E10B1|nr:hypothetical protein [Nakamurella sp. PAMC28650]QNK82633.1 hypothetical protein H7F38_07970 [Nakamurella sp. PAMC28650]